MIIKAKPTAGGGGLNRDRDNERLFSASNCSTDDLRLSTPNGRRLAELEALMEAAEDDPQWIDFWQEWINLWPVVFADLMVKTVNNDSQ